MNRSLLTLVGAAALVSGGQAMAGTCKLESTLPGGEWKFVRVYDVDKGTIVLQRAIKAGEAYDVTVSGVRVRVDSKLPGGIKYDTGPILPCVDGNRIKS